MLNQLLVDLGHFEMLMDLVRGSKLARKSLTIKVTNDRFGISAFSSEC